MNELYKLVLYQKRGSVYTSFIRWTFVMVINPMNTVHLRRNSNLLLSFIWKWKNSLGSLQRMQTLRYNN